MLIKHPKFCFYYVFFIRLSRIAIKQEEASFLSLFLGVFFGVILCTMTILSAVMITLGFIVWCSDMTQRFPS